VVEVQLACQLLIIVQVPEAVGVVPPLGPVTVALKVMGESRRWRQRRRVRARVGVYLATEVGVNQRWAAVCQVISNHR
jgi:hypothetical protein